MEKGSNASWWCLWGYQQREVLKDYALRDQIRRSAISIMFNIAEGFAWRTDKEFRQFLFVARGSLAEVQSALYIALDQKYIDEESFKKLHENCAEISHMLPSLIKYLRDT